MKRERGKDTKNDVTQPDFSKSKASRFPICTHCKVAVECFFFFLHSDSGNFTLSSQDEFTVSHSIFTVLIKVFMSATV